MGERVNPRSDRTRPFYVSRDDAPAKRKILVTALALFVRDGLCETSVRDIAKASGFTNPALFKHFRSKDDLARYLFERCYLELADLVSNAIASGATFAAKQRAVIDAYLAALDRDANSVLYVQDGLRHFWPQMPDRVRRHSIVGDVRRLLEIGRAEGRITDDIDHRPSDHRVARHPATVRAVSLLRRIQAADSGAGGRARWAVDENGAAVNFFAPRG